jgi:DNA invertase Pin-like site-specific DNA recombinase
MPKIGYVRVSTVDQNTDRQEIALSELGIKNFSLKKYQVKTQKDLNLKR